MYVCMYMIKLGVYIHIIICICVYVHVTCRRLIFRIYVYISICIYKYVHICICRCIHIYSYMYTCLYICEYKCVCLCVLSCLDICVYIERDTAPEDLAVRGRGLRAGAGGGSVWDFMSRFSVYPVDDALCLSHCLSLFLSSVCSPTHSPTYQSFTHPFSLFLTLILYFSLSLSLVCTCVRACVSLSPSFSRFRPCILSQTFCLSLHSRNLQQCCSMIRSTSYQILEMWCVRINLVARNAECMSSNIWDAPLSTFSSQYRVV